MGKLNIAHHKSYHPYRRDNIEKVRRDEEEARKQEAVAEGRMMLADSEARIDLLRQRAGVRHDDRSAPSAPDPAEAGPSSVALASGGHVNFFADLEQQAGPRERGVRSRDKKEKEEPAETERGVPLAPSAKDLKPWYSDRSHERSRELDGDRKLRDLARKSVNDPLTSINHQLSARPSHAPAPRMRPPPPTEQPRPPPAPEAARLSRESSERQRALELIRRKKREMAGSETPSTVHGGMDGGYGDVFNRREVEEAHRNRDRRFWRGGGGGGGRW